MATVPDVALPLSCSTNYANDVNDHLRTSCLTGAAWNVCSYIQRRTFGDAGRHRKEGRSEFSCFFDLAKWSLALGCAKPTLLAIRKRLEACKIIRFAQTAPGEGIITWNLSFADWQTYDTRYQKKQAFIYVSPSETVEDTPLNIRQFAVNGVLNIRQPAENTPLTYTSASLEVAQPVAAEEALIKGYENKEETNKDIAATAAQPSLFSDSPIAKKAENVPQAGNDSKKSAEQLLFDALCTAGIQPGTSSETSRAFRYLKELTHAKPAPVLPDELTSIIAWCRKEWTRDGQPMPITAQGISKNLTTIRTQMRAKKEASNGQPQQNSERHVPNATSARRFVLNLKPAGA